MVVLGVNCSSDCAYLAVAEGGELRDGVVESVHAPALGESSDQLLAIRDEFGRILREVAADHVVLLRPESGGGLAKRTHSAHVPRITLEALVRIAAAEADVPIELLARQTLRSRLELPIDGRLVTHVGLRIPTKVGKNWGEERKLAALAALAGEET